MIKDLADLGFATAESKGLSDRDGGEKILRSRCFPQDSYPLSDIRFSKSSGHFSKGPEPRRLARKAKNYYRTCYIECQQEYVKQLVLIRMKTVEKPV
jgi:hypothetical protein